MPITRSGLVTSNNQSTTNNSTHNQQSTNNGSKFANQNIFANQNTKPSNLFANNLYTPSNNYIYGNNFSTNQTSGQKNIFNNNIQSGANKLFSNHTQTNTNNIFAKNTNNMFTSNTNKTINSNDFATLWWQRNDLTIEDFGSYRDEIKLAMALRNLHFLMTQEDFTDWLSGTDQAFRKRMQDINQLAQNLQGNAYQSPTNAISFNSSSNTSNIFNNSSIQSSNIFSNKNNGSTKNFMSNNSSSKNLQVLQNKTLYPPLVKLPIQIWPEPVSASLEQRNSLKPRIQLIKRKNHKLLIDVLNAKYVLQKIMSHNMVKNYDKANQCKELDTRIRSNINEAKMKIQSLKINFAKKAQNYNVTATNHQNFTNLLSQMDPKTKRINEQKSGSQNTAKKAHEQKVIYKLVKMMADGLPMIEKQFKQNQYEMEELLGLKNETSIRDAYSRAKETSIIVEI